MRKKTENSEILFVMQSQCMRVLPGFGNDSVEACAKRSIFFNSGGGIEDFNFLKPFGYS